MDNIALIQKALIEGNTNPHVLVEYKVKLAGEYSFVAGGLEIILARKPANWNAIRANFKSDTACDRAWEATDDGINEMRLRLRIKKIEKMMSAISSLLRVAEGEAKNLF